MSAEPDNAELFPDVNAAGALRAGFQRRHRASADADATRIAPRAALESYELQGEIARGGMGVIVKARDRELGRDVALKVLRDELSHDAKLVRRFLEEARVTARLDHPGIVPVHEVGRDAQGRAYFAMRLVRGRELKRIIELAHAGQEGWNQTRALSVIQKVCEAMAYAHEKGVIHRDLKPSNVMVGEFGEVYVMDWGLARQVGAEDTHDLRLRGAPGAQPADSPSGAQSSAGARISLAITLGAHAAPSSASEDVESPIVTMDGEVLGTPCYMAPEQAQGRIAELGPRSDVYSAGAMLYHLLAGEMPYVPSGIRVASRAVLARLVQGPPRPLHELRSDLPAELIAIAEKAMSREPGDRYCDMLAMADDLRAFLERRVVRAYETGAWAEARKWVKRNRALSGAMTAAFVALAVGLLVSLRLKSESDANFARAEHSAQVAVDERDGALKIAGFLEDTLRGVAPSVAVGRDTVLLREMMDAAWSRIEKGELSAAPEAETRLMLVIAIAYDDIGQYEKAEAVARRTVAAAEDAFRGDHALLAQGLGELGDVLRERGDLVGAEPVARRSLAMHERLHPGDHADVSEQLAKMSELLEDKGDMAGAEAFGRRSLEMRERLFAGDHESVARAANNLGTLLRRSGALSAAEFQLRRAVEMQERLYSGDHPSLASSIDNLAVTLADRGDGKRAAELHERALEMRRRIYAGDHPRLAISLNNMGLALYALGDVTKAEALLREALEMRRRIYAGDHADVAGDLANIAAVLHTRGDLDGAEMFYGEAIDMLRRLLPRDHPTIALQLGNLGVLLKARGDLDGAEALYREELAMLKRLSAGDHPDVAIVLNNLATLLEVRGDLASAESLFREALAMQMRLTPEGGAQAVSFQTHLANLLQHKGDVEGAEALRRESLEMQKRLANPGTERAR